MFSFSVASVSTFLSTSVAAGVAVSLTPLATTVQRAPAGVLGRRGFALESAVARMCRDGEGDDQRPCVRVGFVTNRQPTGWPSLGSGC